jgi:hypothetical protein
MRHVSWQWYEGGAAVGESSFSIQEANAAGLTGKQTWKGDIRQRHAFRPRPDRGARRYAPGIFGGAPIYTPDEMGVDTDEDGHIVQGRGDQRHPARQRQRQARATGDR